MKKQRNTKGKVYLEEMKRIARKHRGLLRASDIVEEARPVKNPLHSAFEWNDTEAAERYRIWQARQLIAVSVEYLENVRTEEPVRVFASLKSDRKNGGYRAVADLLSDDEMREQLLQDALEDMIFFRRKYRQLEELSAVFEEMDKVAVHVRPRIKATT